MDNTPSDQALAHAYTQQLEAKEQQLNTLLHPFGGPAVRVFPSPASHYRMRAEFRVWHEGEDLFYVMFDSDTREKYRVDQLPAANLRINELMPLVLAYVKNKEPLRRKLFQVDFLTSSTGEALISLLYHKQLDSEWQAMAEQMHADFNQLHGKVDFIGRARKQKVLLYRDKVTEALTVHGRTYSFEHIENSFTQPNARVNEKMIEWACSVAGSPQHDLLELYCGNGNFSLPLAQHFKRVLGTEISRSSVVSAQTNIALNKITNARIERLAAEDLTAVMNGSALPSRLADMQLQEYDFATVLVDPPRAGLDPATLAMVSKFENIIYISCNPETLAENLQVLQQTHRVKHTALFDQFPFTHHIEAGVYLTKQ